MRPGRSKVSRATLAAGAAGVALLILVGLACRNRSRAGPSPFADDALLRPFAGPTITREAYEGLFRYFLSGFVTYQNGTGSAAHYPGLASTHGKAMDAMEGFTRFAPLVAAWLHSGRAELVELPGGRQVDLVGLIRNGVRVGTDPASPDYWGRIEDRDQRMVEAADVALTLWLTRRLVWDRLNDADREKVHRWLADGIGRSVPDNNWLLFPTLVALVLRDLGSSVDLVPVRKGYDRLKSFYRGEGWFSDGPGRVFDYYNAWAIHYHLAWIDRVSPDWDPDFIRSSRREFLLSYKHLIGPSGVPIRGRSICYRMATPAPLVLDHAGASPSTTAGEARRALDLVWSYFIRRGAVEQGSVTQGYCGADERLLDNYSGPASCLWSLRSLIPALAIPAGDAFWREPQGVLPIDRASYRIRVSSIGWTIVGNAEAGTTALTADDSLPDSLTALQSARAWTELKARLSGRPNRPRNRRAKYQQGTYASEPPFCGCKQSP